MPEYKDAIQYLSLANYQMAENKMIKAVQVLRQAKQQETLGYVYLLSRLGYCNVKCGR